MNPFFTRRQEVWAGEGQAEVSTATSLAASFDSAAFPTSLHAFPDTSFSFSPLSPGTVGTVPRCILGAQLKGEGCWTS